MLRLVLTYDMWGPSFAKVPLHEHYAAMLNQCEYADANGFTAICFNEHHATDDGYIPSPLVATAAVAARTRRVALSPLLLTPLYDVLRLAEDLAVADLISGGRLEPVLAAGYRPQEFQMFGRDLKQRRDAVDEGIQTLHQAWTGEPFEHRGRTVRVTPRPARRPGPPIHLAGSSRVAAHTAARLADGFYPDSPGFWQPYREECLKLGKPDPGPARTRGPMFLHISKDPDHDWPLLAPYLLNAIRQYGGWTRDNRAVPPQFLIADEKALRASHAYQVLTPDEAVDLIKGLGDHGQLILRPMWGGYDPALGWSSLKLLVEDVLPHVGTT